MEIKELCRMDYYYIFVRETFLVLLQAILPIRVSFIEDYIINRFLESCFHYFDFVNKDTIYFLLYSSKAFKVKSHFLRQM